MEKYYCTLFLLLFLTIINFNLVKCTEPVPVVSWNVNDHGSISALQHIGKKYFKEIVESYLKDNPFVVVFKDENLSTEDFTNRDTSGRNVFYKLQTIIDESNKGKLSYMPAVQSPQHVLRTMAKGKETVLTASELRSGDKKLPTPIAGQFLIINLDEADDNEDRQHLLKRHVKFMSEIFKKIHNQFPNTIGIYTASHPSWSVPSLTVSRKSRHLLQAPESESNQRATNNKPQKFVNEFIRFYVGDSPVIIQDKTSTPLKNIKFSTTGNDTRIELNGDSENNKFTFEFINSKGWYWILQSVTVNDVEMKVKDVSVPLVFSYHCNDLRLFSKELSIVFPKVQFQPNFTNSAPLNGFGDPYDCVGFTSIPIWSGLFVTLLLAAIMTLGLTMMMDIKTMDRFDDPKGKGVTINVVE